jgi:ribosomal protein S18 acetylase RimI-like enzyme
MAAVTRATSLGAAALEVQATRDRAMLARFLERDRLFAAYALCDLDDREFSKTRWAVALASGRVVALCMEYRGLSPQPLFVMGDAAGVSAILAGVIRTRVAYLAAMPSLLPAIAERYRIDDGPPMVRMVVDRETFRPLLGKVVRLGPQDAADLNRLYELGLTAWLPGEAISNGVYYGVRRQGRLVAAAGTHVISEAAGLAAVGNVMTHRDHRGQGYAKAVTSAVTAELLERCTDVVLNVRSDNPPAIAAYRRIGYREHLRFEERLVHRHGSLWDSILTPLRQHITFPRRNA